MGNGRTAVGVAPPPNPPSPRLAAEGLSCAETPNGVLMLVAGPRRSARRARRASFFLRIRPGSPKGSGLLTTLRQMNSLFRRKLAHSPRRAGLPGHAGLGTDWWGCQAVGKKARVHTENTENAPRATEKKPTRFARSAIFFLGGSRWSSVFSVWNLACLRPSHHLDPPIPVPPIALLPTPSLATRPTLC